MVFIKRGSHGNGQAKVAVLFAVSQIAHLKHLFELRHFQLWKSPLSLLLQHLMLAQNAHNCI